MIETVKIPANFILIATNFNMSKTSVEHTLEFASPDYFNLSQRRPDSFVTRNEFLDMSVNIAELGIKRKREALEKIAHEHLTIRMSHETYQDLAKYILEHEARCKS